MVVSLYTFAKFDFMKYLQINLAIIGYIHRIHLNALFWHYSVLRDILQGLWKIIRLFTSVAMVMVIIVSIYSKKPSILYVINNPLYFYLYVLDLWELKLISLTNQIQDSRELMNFKFLIWIAKHQSNSLKKPLR